MNFKIKSINFAKLTIIISVLIYLSLFVIVKLIIDPYKEFQFFDFKINKKQFFLSVKHSPYLLSEKLLHNKFTIIFGTSRSALIDGDILKDNVINFSLGMNGNPIDIYNFLINLDERKIKNINKIYYLVDYHTFGNKSSYYKDKIYSHNLFNRMYYSFKSFNIASIKYAYQSILMNLRKDNDWIFKDYGILEHINSITNVSHIWHPEPIKFSKKAFSNLANIDIFLKKHKITIIYFNVPLYSKFIERMDIEQVQKQAKAITKNIDYFYDFRCLPYISKLPENFTTPNHPRYEAIKVVLNNLSSNFKVNKSNVDVFYKYKWNQCKNNYEVTKN